MSAERCDDRVSTYLSRHKKWATPLGQIRTLLLATDLQETIKWSGPAYSLDGRVVIGLAGFKNHCAIWFHQGVFLSDPDSKLRNAQESTRAMRQWRIEANDRLPQAILKKYIKEAIANERAGKRISPQRKKTGKPPPELAGALAEDKALKSAFENLTPGKQREFMEHIAMAKRPATRLARLQKACELILAGSGLHDQYR